MRIHFYFLDVILNKKTKTKKQTIDFNGSL